MEEIVAQHSGQTLKKVSKDMERDYFTQLRGLDSLRTRVGLQGGL